MQTIKQGDTVRVLPDALDLYIFSSDPTKEYQVATVFNNGLDAYIKLAEDSDSPWHHAMLSTLEKIVR